MKLKFTILFYTRALAVVLISLMASGSAIGQTISGPTTVYNSLSYDYSFTQGAVVVGPSWSATNGTVVTTWVSGTVYYATVKWTSTGTGTVKLTSSADGVMGTLTVSIGSCGVGAPSPNAASFSRCAAGTFTLQATPGSGGTSINWYNASTGGTFLGSGTSYTTGSLSVNTTFYFTTVNTTTGCESTPRTSSIAKVNAIPAAPTIVSSVNACGSGGVAVLTGTPSTGSVAWYNNNTSGKVGSGSLATGNTYSPTLTATTTFYMASYNSGTGCETAPASRTAITGTVSPIPAAATNTTGAAGSVCGSGAVTLTGTAGTNGNSLRWYAASSGGSALATGTSYSPTISATTNYYITTYNTSTGCESTAARTTATGTVNPLPGAPTAINSYGCIPNANSTIALTLTGTPGTNANAFSWYTEDEYQTGSNPYSVGASYFGTPPISTTTKYYMSSYNTTTHCTGPDQVPIWAYVNIAPAPVAPVTAQGGMACGSGRVTLLATVPSGSTDIHWYLASGGPLQGTSNVYTTPTLTTTTQYIALSYNASTTCESTTGPTVTAAVNPVPTITAVGYGQTICSGSPTVISLSSNLSGAVYSWSTTPTTGISGNTNRAHVSTTSIADVLTNQDGGFDNITYSIWPTVNGCDGVPANVLVNVNPVPTLSVNNNLPAICSGQQSTNIALGTTNGVAGTVYSWTLAKPADISGATSATNTTSTTIAQPLIVTGNPPDSVAYSITASVTHNSVTCTSPAITTRVKVKPVPVATVISNQTIFVGSSTNTSVNSNVANTSYISSLKSNNNVAHYTNGIGAINPFGQALTVADNINPGNITFNIVPVAGGCAGATDTSRVNVYPMPTITATRPRIYMGLQSTLSAQTFYDTYSWQSKAGTQTGVTTVTAAVPDTYNLSVTKNGVGATTRYAVGGQFTGIDQNYIVTNSLMTAETDTARFLSLPIDSVSQSIQYFDGLGRLMQTVATQGSPTKKDLVQPVVYDAFGREYRKYLPFTGGNDGTYKSGVIDGAGHFAGVAQGFYGGSGGLIANDTAYYAKTIFEASPLNRVLQEYGPGASWQANNKAVLHAYPVNEYGTAAGQEKIIIWTIGTGGLPVRYTSQNSGYYTTGQLVVQSATDENGHETRQYTDKRGNMVLKKVYVTGTTTDFITAGNWAETYYIYDNYNKLRCTMQPELSKVVAASTTYNPTATDLAKYGYVYRYDTRLRPIVKKVPGADSVYTVYDLRDRVVLTQDGNMRAKKQWSFIKYDTLNRPVMTGIYTHSSVVSQAVMAGLISTSKFSEAINTGATHGYTTNVFPTTSLDVYSATYYDDYGYVQAAWGSNFNYVNDGLTNGTYTQPASSFVQTTGQVTGSKIKVLDGGSTYLRTINYYDDRGRMVQAIAENYKGGSDRSSMLYDFTGRTLQTKTYHNGGGTNQVSVVKKTTFDHSNRPLSIAQNINGGADQVAVQYSYNELGQVVDKGLHNTGGSSFIQSVDYRYNVRGWMTSINNAQLTSDGVMNNDTNDYFGMELLYATQDAGIGNQVSYSGNISAMKWKGMTAPGAADQRSYRFVYDNMNRLTNALFQANSGTGWNKEVNTLNERLGYDLNGNIMTLARVQNLRGLSGLTVTSTPQKIDSLAYTYASGNQVSKIEDMIATTIGTGDFKNGASTTTEYTYDALGSVTADQNKGIDSVVYNVLGKPVRVKYHDGRLITYAYDAMGTKLVSKTYNASAVLQATMEYVNGFVYTNSALSFFSSPEGRVVKNGSNYEYQYTITDHLGNTRVLFTSVAPTAQSVTATFETANQPSEATNFNNYPSTSGINVVATYAHSGSNSQYLNGGYAGMVGVSKSYKVYAGDQVSIQAYASYNTPGSTGSAITNFAAALLSSFSLPAPAVGETGTASAAIGNFGGMAAGGFADGSTDITDPKAFVTILLFDRNYNFVDMTHAQVGASGSLLSASYTVREPGYAFVYVSNENSTLTDIYFDDVTVTYTPTSVLQYNEYYPFGLQAAESWTRDNVVTNRYLYNGKELQDDFGLEWYDYGARMYDPQIGRWTAVDAKAENYMPFTVYGYVLNNPAVLIDPNGMEVKEIDGGYAYTGDDAQAALNFLFGNKTNIYIALLSNDKLRANTNSQSAKGFYGQWTVFAAKNIKEGVFLTSFLDPMSVKNMVFESHAGVAKNTKMNSLFTNEDKSDGSRITSRDILYYLMGNADNSKIDDLKALMSKIASGGNFVFTGCNLGLGEDGDDFLHGLFNLADGRLNIMADTQLGRANLGTKNSKGEFIIDNGISINGSLTSEEIKIPHWKGISLSGDIYHFSDVLITTVGGPPITFKKR